MATTTYTDTTMAARAIGARTTYAGAAATDLSAEEDRLAHELLTEGILAPDDGFVPAKGSAATMNVVIGSNASKTDIAVIAGDAVGQGRYMVRLTDATKTLTLGAADPSNPRIDEVYIVVRDDAYDGTGRALPSLAVRQGDAAVSPVAPGPDGVWDAYLLIATVAVPAAAADIIACTLTDNRVYAALTLAGDIVLDRNDANNETQVKAISGTIGFYIAGTKYLSLSATTLDLQGRTITNVTTVDGVDLPLHAHTGADGSAQVAHGSLTGLTAGDPHTQYLLESGFTKAAIDALNVDADTLDGLDSTGFALAGHDHAATYLGIAATAANSTLLGGKAEAALDVDSATRWATGRTITLTGGVTAVSAAWDGTGNLSIATTLRTLVEADISNLGNYLGAGSHAAAGSDITVQSGGSPSGGQNGDIFLIY